MSKHINQYIKEISAASQDATEFTLRTPLENLLNGLAAAAEVTEQNGEITVQHEPSRRGGIGAPDFLLTDDGGAIIGYVECKKPGVNLDKLIGGEQLTKYGNLSDNVLLTDYWRFIFLQSGKPPREADLSAAPANKQKLKDILVDFMSAEIRRIDDPKKLAEILAARCAALRDELERELSDASETNPLKGLESAFKTTLYPDITPKQFADALAQTVTYTLLLAKLNASDGEKLNIYGLKQHIPKNFALIRGISGFLDNIEDTPLKYLMDAILAVIHAMDKAALAEKSEKHGGTDEDPYFYFYEKFLAAYDKKLRKSCGVYYTPPAVVKFIVRATDDILRRDFDKSEGLADFSVTALDIAAGTGAFMKEIIRIALENKNKAERDIIVRHHLLKNLFGFELLVAPYVIAHLKLSAFLAENDIALGENERINIFLTNTLENNPPQKALEIIPELTKEVKRAHEIKEQPILVITGNPPYSGHGQTKNAWVWKLLRDYYQVDGKKLDEKVTKWLHDDYVKFIRFAQHKISEAGQGVVAIITNHGFLDNPTFRGMRQSLLNTFDQLYFLDLHGNAPKRETTPGGGKDENVFDIKQGVAVSLLVKKPGLSKGVFHADLWGMREEKYAACLEYTVDSISWKELEPAKPFYLFIPQDKKVRAEYEKFYPLNNIFSANSIGIITGRDALTIRYQKEEIEKVVEQFVNMSVEGARIHFNLGPDARDWRVDRAQKDLRRSGLIAENFRPVAYRPFDTRHTYYTGKSRGFHVSPSHEIMQHMLMGDNIGLVSVRQVAEKDFTHAFVSDKIINSRMTLSNKGSAYLFPLYCYETDMGEIVRVENLAADFRQWLNNRYGKKHTPEDILGCIYALLHAPEYRQRYAEFLRLDYPRVPFPKDSETFCHLADIGKKLMDAHLLRAHCNGEIKLNGSGKSHIVEKVHYDEREQRLYFNKDEYLSPLSQDIFDYEIGGYKPLDKFLKSRKGRDIGADIETLKKAANAIAFTARTVKEIVLP